MEKIFYITKGISEHHLSYRRKKVKQFKITFAVPISPDENDADVKQDMKVIYDTDASGFLSTNIAEVPEM